MSTTATQTITATTSGPSVKVIKNGFGAEITGLDFANGVTEEGYRFIEDAVKKVRSALEPPIKWDLTDSL
jgi:alpha-ketoglutarate-dependent 2,4-dichlorophenoxyacetate dioxygenase